LEELVSEGYDRTLPEVSGFCGCQLCREDVLVFVLNRLPPRYSAQPAGEILTRVSLELDQQKASLIVALMEGFRRVQASPRPGHPPPAAKAG
jgi:competence protein ComFB